VHYSFECVGSEIPLDIGLLLKKKIPSPANALKIVIQFKHIQVHTFDSSGKQQQEATPFGNNGKQRRALKLLKVVGDALG
jgi:hypothetical protein